MLSIFVVPPDRLWQLREEVIILFRKLLYSKGIDLRMEKEKK